VTLTQSLFNGKFNFINGKFLFRVIGKFNAKTDFCSQIMAGYLKYSIVHFMLFEVRCCKSSQQLLILLLSLSDLLLVFLVDDDSFINVKVSNVFD
jgi:hypothetical protein